MAFKSQKLPDQTAKSWPKLLGGEGFFLFSDFSYRYFQKNTTAQKIGDKVELTTRTTPLISLSALVEGVHHGKFGGPE